MPGSPTVVNTFTADLQLIPVPKQLWGMPFCLHDETWLQGRELPETRPAKEWFAFFMVR